MVFFFFFFCRAKESAETKQQPSWVNAEEPQTAEPQMLTQTITTNVQIPLSRNKQVNSKLQKTYFHSHGYTYKGG